MLRACIYGGVGAPVGLTVFKTAGGSLGAVPGGFDSHTPLLSMLISIHFSSAQRTLEGHKRATDLLALHQLFFTVQVQRLQDWSVTDGEQVCLKICLVVNAGPGRSHEDIARAPLEAHTVDHRAAAALKNHVDGTARLAFRGCACAGI